MYVIPTLRQGGIEGRGGEGISSLGYCVRHGTTGESGIGEYFLICDEQKLSFFISWGIFISHVIQIEGMDNKQRWKI